MPGLCTDGGLCHFRNVSEYLLRQDSLHAIMGENASSAYIQSVWEFRVN